MAELPGIEEFAKAAAKKVLDDYEFNGKTIREWAELLLNGNAVEVVRCKDCLNYKETMGKDSDKPCGYGRCLHPSGLKAIVFDEFFCPHGERREGDG